MAATPQSPVISHWHKSVGDFNTSAVEFYAALEAAIRRREPPETMLLNIEHREGGITSAARRYLRISRRYVAFDICAAPFGRDFFFSWWLVKVPPSIALGCVTLFFIVSACIAGAGWALDRYGLKSLFIAGLLGLLGLLFIGSAVRSGELAWEETILALPFLGRVYEWIFQPPTYYRIDTALMFQETVHAAVLEVLDSLLSANGLRALSEGERKPILQDFMR